MKKAILSAILGLGGLFLAGTVYAQVPHEIGGFVLGARVAAYKDRFIMSTAWPVRYREYLTEVEVKVPAGFKSGLVEFGNCEKPERIVKISLKYADPHKAFFDKLLKHFKARFGSPTQWRGDPFDIYRAWKWSFVDRHHNRISMILQHYEGHEDIYKNGNSVKLTMTSLVEKEDRCYDRQHPATQGPAGQQGKRIANDTEGNFNRFIPR